MKDSKFEQIISELYQNGEYRPTGVFLLYDDRQRFLIVQSAKDYLAWGFPQGGIELDESLPENMERELGEELGIDAKTELESIIFGYQWSCLDAEERRRDKRGFSKGKAYFFSAAKYIGKRKLILKEDEVSKFVWLSRKEMLPYLRSRRKEKADLLERAL